MATRRPKRGAFYKSETLKKLSEMSADGAAMLLREDVRLTRRRQLRIILRLTDHFGDFLSQHCGSIAQNFLDARVAYRRNKGLAEIARWHCENQNKRCPPRRHGSEGAFSGNSRGPGPEL